MRKEISRREFLQSFAAGALYSSLRGYDHFDPHHAEYEPPVVPVTTLGLRGSPRGIGGLGYHDDGVTETQNAQEFLNVAWSRQERVEAAFGRPLKTHLIISSFYQKNSQRGTQSEHTGTIIPLAFPFFAERERDLTISIELTPPAWYTIPETADVMRQIMTGEFNNLPREVLVEHIHNISLSYDFERVVWGNSLHDGSTEHNLIRVSTFNELIHAPYVELHRQLQREHAQLFGSNHSDTDEASTRLYNFGTTSIDDFFDNDSDFLASIYMDADPRGTAETKAQTAENFAELYGREVNMLFALPGSPHLDVNTIPGQWPESDTGFAPWDFDAVKNWALQHSRGSMIIFQ